MSKTPKLGIRVDEDTNLCMIEERHAQELYDLVDANRAYLREWLPWVDYETSVEDSKAFIKHALQQFASSAMGTINRPLRPAPFIRKGEEYHFSRYTHLR